ncbi:hypothetical protein [Streptomyces sp. XY332]|uniref:hypothetical protein n=1 Tax=Streptomyces sp. XY332 TaxID=1415561 RepID=UPI0006B1C548|nr:hypothetical protein [Streptomyces sp. XY332]KOY53442.1 hypothetical protein ADK59_35775 [Streptomyces sp. XY332]
MIIYTGVPAIMRIQRLVAVSTAALLCLTALTACGSDEGKDSLNDYLDNQAPAKNGGTDGLGGSDGNGKAGLPKAGSMAKAAQIVNGYGDCSDISTDPHDDDFFPGDETYDSKWAVSERGACGKGTRIFMIKDLKTFQATYKAELDADRKESPNKGHRGKFLLGQDFAVLPDQKPVIRNAIKPGGLLILNCHPDFNPPSGYRKDPALVKGCVLTDYFED